MITMPKGGARARSGPAPNPNALRRSRDVNEWVTLPAEGRTGEPPAWPLTRPLARELALWAELWSRPQATMWEQQSQQHEVALYVRRLVEAEKRDSAVNLSTLVRQMADSLGLTTPGMRAARWRIEPTVAEVPVPAAARPARSSSRSRLKVVSGGDGE
jgi:hypothetical protein